MTRLRPVKTIESGFSERLEQVIKDRFGGSKSALAKAAGISLATVYSYFRNGRGCEPRLSALVAVARASGVGIGWLASGRGPREERDAEPESNAIPVFISMKRGETLFGREAFAALGGSTGWLADRYDVPLNSGLLIEVAGDSMSPLLQEGDLALAVMQDRLTADGVYLFKNGEDASEAVTVRRITRREGGMVELIAENSSYPARAVRPGSLQLIARVVAVVGSICS